MDRKDFDAYLAHFNTRDYSGVLGYYAESFELHFAGYVFASRAEVENFYGFFHDYVSEAISVTRFVADAQTVVIEAGVRLTCRKDLTQETLAKHGLERLVTLNKGDVIELPQFIHYHLVDGKIVKAVCAMVELPQA